MLTMKNLQAKYDLVNDDGYDSRIPLHNEEAFQHGLFFQAKYIGTLDVPRPSSRVEIVAAMRRIRYEFKAKAIKKKKVDIYISTDGVKVVLSKRGKKQACPPDDVSLLVMQHPIYRIFYVSHDSQDLKIFSYIARDGSTNVFKCNVFKAYKKSHAMRVVRTIGQAFEVCHKKTIEKEQEKEQGNEADSEKSSVVEPVIHKSPMKVSVKTAPLTTSTPRPTSTPQSPEEVLRQARDLLNTVRRDSDQVAGTISSPCSPPLDSGDYLEPTPQPLSMQHHVQLLRQQLEQQMQMTQVAVAHSNLLKDQLAAETAARNEAQARTHQLLVQNRELLEHINTLVGRLQYLESKVMGSSYKEAGLYRSSQVEESGGCGARESLAFSVHSAADFTESPDSGHREMSSDSLACSTGPPEPWYANSTTVSQPGAPQHHHAVQRSVSSNGYTKGSMSANNRPDLNLPLRSSANPFAPEATKSNYANINEAAVITALPCQDASANKLDLNVAPKLDPPPKVERRSNRASLTTPTTMVTSPDTNGNCSMSSVSTLSDNSFEAHLNLLLQQASLTNSNMADNLVNERREKNKKTVGGGNEFVASEALYANDGIVNTQMTYSNLGADLSNQRQAMSPIRLSTLSFSDEENTEEMEEDDMRNILQGTELEMFNDLEAASKVVNVYQT